MPLKLDKQLSWPELVEHEIAAAQKANFRINFDKFKEFLESLEPVGHCFDFQLKARCYYIKGRLEKDYDHFVAIHGFEGEGKSTLANQMGSAINPKKQPVTAFTFEQIVQAVKKAQKGDVVIIDEGATSLYSREAMSKINRVLTKLFMIMRQKNLCLIICIPNFHLLDSYIRDHRTNTLIGVKKRGRYICYTGRAIKRISRLGGKFKEVFGVRVASGSYFEGNFLKDFPNNFDLKGYLKQKQEHMESFIKELEEEKSTEMNFVPVSKYAKLLNFTNDAVRDGIKKGRIPGKQIAGRYYVTKEAFNDMHNTMRGNTNK